MKRKIRSFTSRKKWTAIAEKNEKNVLYFFSLYQHCTMYIRRSQNEETHAFYGVQVSIGRDFHVQQHMHNIHPSGIQEIHVIKTPAIDLDSASEDGGLQPELLFHSLSGCI